MQNCGTIQKQSGSGSLENFQLNATSFAKVLKTKERKKKTIQDYEVLLTEIFYVVRKKEIKFKMNDNGT